VKLTPEKPEERVVLDERAPGLTGDKRWAPIVVQYVNEHVRLYGCRFENGRWRHFCGKKDLRKDPAR